MHVVVAYVRGLGLDEQLGSQLPERVRQLAGRAHQVGFVTGNEAGVQLRRREGGVANHPA